MTRTRKNAVVGLILIAVAATATYLFYRLERSHQRAMAEVSEAAAILEETVPDDAEPAAVTVYAMDPDPTDPGNPRLEAKTESIVAGEPILRAQQIVAAALRNLQGTLPPQARVRQVYLLDDGTAVVDLSRETSEQLQGGVTAELGVITAITRSLLENMPQVKSVRFLVEGEERPTFSGHVSLSRPFR